MEAFPKDRRKQMPVKSKYQFSMIERHLAKSKKPRGEIKQKEQKQNKWVSPIVLKNSEKQKAFVTKLDQFTKSRTDFFTKEDQKHMEMKHLKMELKTLMKRFCPQEKKNISFFQQYQRLSEESFDCIEYHIKNQPFFEEQNSVYLNEKQIIVSMLKNHYPCFTKNPPNIINRIFLAMAINPMNDFQFVSWELFSKLKKIMYSEHSRNDGKIFLANFIFIQACEIKISQFWSIISSIINKLQIVLSESALLALIQRIKKCASTFFNKAVISKSDLMNAFTAEPMFIWQQLIKLIFST